MGKCLENLGIPAQHAADNTGVSNEGRCILIDHETVHFFRAGDMQMQYTGCGDTEHSGLKARVLP